MPLHFTAAPFKAIASIAVAVASLALAAPASAEYPDKPVKVVVGFAPGGTNDILARLISVKLGERLKQSFVVENRAGANSIIAAEFSAKAPADGYTLFVASSGALTVNPALYAKLPYDPARDFQPIALLGSFPLVITTNAASSVRTMADLKAMGRKSADGSLNHGVASSSFQLAAELYARESGMKFTHVNYKGTGPVLNGLLGNEVELGFVDIAAVLPQIQGGKLRALAVTTARRSKVLPDVPTVAESGTPGYDVPIWTGLVAPAGTPAEATDRLKAALKQVLAEPDTIVRLQALGMEPGNVDSAAFGRQITGDIQRWTALARSANIKAE
ncbi:MAG: tripartite tricarboxylate transporter substrate binding protein [Comamonadaceae bacterium]|nr:MAG: tripartite tricarboxylate transporter substrate binding protein [Comamonadaceae bacterium]